ncbi:PocR ligand-binding domain-containing protein [Tessaracoccus lapidicaptus]|uniref:PocR ligand-binding domain-containing protein n=1 Tax=Tessaracoccus lapidicaptus TaxID=1427523 RepID=UPI0033421EBF
MSVVEVSDARLAAVDLRTLIDLEELQRIQDDFAADTGLAMITVDSMGTPVTRASEFSALCRFLRQDPEIRRRCFSCDAHGGFQSALEGKPFVYRCHAGLVDFSVGIMMGPHYLGAILAGQVLLTRGQGSLSKILATSDDLGDPGAVAELMDQVRVVELSKIESAADAIVTLANRTLSGRSATYHLPASTGPYLGRLKPLPPQDPTSDEVLAPLLAGKVKQLPLVPLQALAPDESLDAERIARNLHAADVGANLQLLSDYLDRLLPRWSQKLPPSRLAEYEDVLIGLASGEGVHHGREVSQVVIRHRNRRRPDLNRYECQLYCEKLLILLHTLVEPELLPRQRTIATLLNEIEKDPTSFLTCGKAAEYLMWSESHFARRFKDKTGESFIHYVTAKRLERAKLMLIHTPKPVLRIATELGFQPANYFSRTFKKLVGVTPSEFRDEHARQDRP